MQITEDDGMNTILETVHSRRNTCQFTVLRAYSRTIPILKIRGSFSTNRQLDRRVVTFATAHSSDPALMGRLTRISVTYYVNRALREREREASRRAAGLTSRRAEPRSFTRRR